MEDEAFLCKICLWRVGGSGCLQCVMEVRKGILSSTGGFDMDGSQEGGEVE